MHFLLLTSCQTSPPEPSAPSPGPDPIDPSPWTFSTDAPPPPDPDLDQLGRVIEAAVPEVLGYDAEPVVDAYQAFQPSTTPTCPPVTIDPYGNQFFVGYCTAPDGTYFGGYLSDYLYAGTYDPESQMTYDGRQLAGNVAFDGPAGTLDLEGGAAYITGQSQDGLVTLVESSLAGGFFYDHAHGWLSDPTSATIALVGYAIPSVGGIAVVVDGGVPVEVDGDTYEVVFHAAGVANAAAGSLCDEEPGGSVDVRDPWGRWFTVTFQGPNLGYDGGDPTRCDGCGDATADGSDLGSVCADFSPWFQWEKLP